MRQRSLLSLLVILLLAAGHVGYWYWPRTHLRAPVGSDEPARLLVSGTYAVAAWMPYPHQNLGELRRSLAGWERLMPAAARLAGITVPRWPSFGPFSLPPARELCVAWNPGGSAWGAAARVYPAVALAARLGGRLAANPWLSGGKVDMGEREAQIGWQGTLWTVRAGESMPPQVWPGSSAQPSLAVIHLRQPIPPIPAGLYRVHRHAGDIVVKPVGADGVEVRSAHPRDDGSVALLLYSGADGPLGEQPSALALFARGDQPHHELPAAAVWHRPGAKRWSLPGEQLTGALGLKLPKGESAGWSLVATDARSLERARSLTGKISYLSSADSATSPSFGLWMKPRPTWKIAVAIRSTLEAFPLGNVALLQRWHDAETVLSELALFERIWLQVGPGTGDLVLHMERAAAEAAGD